MVGMFFKEALDFLPVVLKLAFQGVEQFNQSQRQAALGSRDRRAAAELMGFGKNLQTFLIELRTVEAVNVQEAFPFSATSLLQQLRSRKFLHKTPARTGGPILKGLQRRRIVLVQCGL